MLIKSTNIVILAIVFCLINISVVWALDSLIISINRAAIIANPSNANDVRALLRFDLPQELDTTKYIAYAELRLNVNVPQRFDNIIRLKVCPITRDWSPQDTRWNGTWSTPGGDFADTISAIARIDSSGSSVIRIDVAHIIHYFVRSYIPNYGLLIRQQGSNRRAFGIIPQRGPNSDVAQIAIYYVDMDPDD